MLRLAIYKRESSFLQINYYFTQFLSTVLTTCFLNTKLFLNNSLKIDWKFTNFSRNDNLIKLFDSKEAANIY